LALLLGCSDRSAGPDVPDDNPAEPRTLYVDAAAEDSHDGLSWASAFTHPQDAVDAASSGDRIWVAAGSYASREPASPEVPVVALKERLRIYGGFVPGDTSLSLRDPLQHPTILDGGGAAHHVVAGADGALIDGFTITGGNAQGDAPHDAGGGIFIWNATMMIERCAFTSNRAALHGAGVFMKNSAASLNECTFIDNRAALNGGAIYADCEGSPDRRPSIRACVFSDNRDSRFGGAVFTSHCSAEIAACTFSGNYANHNGGALYGYFSSLSVSDCVFTGNTSYKGAAVYINANGAHGPSLARNCLFAGNEAFESGGGIYLLNVSFDVFDCTLTGNSARYGGALSIWNSDARIANCILWNDTALFSGPELDIGYESTVLVSFSTVNQDGYGLVPGGQSDASGNMRLDPLFVPGALGDYYLSHLAAGESSDSPCIDAGSESAEALHLEERTTRSDGAPDSGMVDIGYHYAMPPALEP
jgi:predicted outer membrane repeat protein